MSCPYRDYRNLCQLLALLLIVYYIINLSYSRFGNKKDKYNPGLVTSGANIRNYGSSLTHPGYELESRPLLCKCGYNGSDALECNCPNSPYNETFKSKQEGMKTIERLEENEVNKTAPRYIDLAFQTEFS